MNILPANITSVQSSEGILLIDLLCEYIPISSLMIEGGSIPTWIVTGNQVRIAFKETEVSLAKSLSGQLSIRNQLPCVVKEIKAGQLLSQVFLQFGKFSIVSAITSRSVENLDLKPGDLVTALVKSNEMSLLKIEKHD